MPKHAFEGDPKSVSFRMWKASEEEGAWENLESRSTFRGSGGA